MFPAYGGRWNAFFDGTYQSFSSFEQNRVTYPEGLTNKTQVCSIKRENSKCREAELGSERDLPTGSMAGEKAVSPVGSVGNTTWLVLTGLGATESLLIPILMPETVKN